MLTWEVAAAAAPLATSPERVEVAAIAPPLATSSEVPTKRTRLEPTPAADGFWERLSQLVPWRTQGLLSPEQFEHAKSALRL